MLAAKNIIRMGNSVECPPKWTGAPVDTSENSAKPHVNFRNHQVWGSRPFTGSIYSQFSAIFLTTSKIFAGDPNSFAGLTVRAGILSSNQANIRLLLMGDFRPNLM